MDNKLFEKALEMPPNERVTFAELILASIDHEEEAVRQAWLAEVQNRMNSVKNGRSKLIDFESLYYEG